MKTIIKLTSCIVICVLLVIVAGCEDYKGQVEMLTIENEKLKDDQTDIKRVVDDYKDQVEMLTIENEELKDDKTVLERTVADYKLKETKQNDLFVAFSDIPDQVRFVEQKNIILALPQEGSKIFNSIQTNTLVKVIDRALVIDSANSDGRFWIYVQVPVYDTGANFKGWMLEADSVPYTTDKKKQVQSDVGIKSGAKVYETYKFEDIKNTTPRILKNDSSGRLEEKREGYCRFFQAGGVVVW